MLEILKLFGRRSTKETESDDARTNSCKSQSTYTLLARQAIFVCIAQLNHEAIRGKNIFFFKLLTLDIRTLKTI